MVAPDETLADLRTTEVRTHPALRDGHRGAPREVTTPAELRALLDYANRFHHDTNPAWETAVINDQELLGFATRTLAFSSR